MFCAIMLKHVFIREHKGLFFRDNTRTVSSAVQLVLVEDSHLNHRRLQALQYNLNSISYYGFIFHRHSGAF